MVLAALFWDFWFRITGRALFMYQLSRTRGARKAVSEVSDSKHVKHVQREQPAPGGQIHRGRGLLPPPATALARSPYSDFHPTSPPDLSAPVLDHAPALARGVLGARGRRPGGGPAKDQTCGSPFLRVGGRFFAEGRIGGL